MLEHSITEFHASAIIVFIMDFVKIFDIDVIIIEFYGITNYIADNKHVKYSFLIHQLTFCYSLFCIVIQ